MSNIKYLYTWRTQQLSAPKNISQIGAILRARVRFPILSLEFLIDIILQTAVWLWDRLKLKRNEYQEYFLGGDKGGRYIGLTNLLPSCADCLQIWEPQPPWHLRVCPGPQAYRDYFTFTDKEAPHYELFFVPLLPCSSLSMKKEKSDLANRKEDGWILQTEGMNYFELAQDKVL